MNFLKEKTDFERKSIFISISFTVIIHIAIIFLLSNVAKAENIENKPISIETRILRKGKKDGTNSINSKKKNIRKKKKNFMPDKIKKKKISAKKKAKKTEKKAVKKNIKKDVTKLGKKKKDKDKSNSKKVEKDISGDLLNSLNSINPAIPDKKVSKKGGLGPAKGDEKGIEGGDETDPNKSIAGSLYERRIAIKIKSRWSHQPLEDKNISVTIRLFIGNDGKISNFKVIKKSSNQFFNNSIIRTLNSIKKVEAPAEKFRKYYQKNGLLIHFYPKK